MFVSFIQIHLFIDSRKRAGWREGRRRGGEGRKTGCHKGIKGGRGEEGREREEEGDDGLRL